MKEKSCLFKFYADLVGFRGVRFGKRLLIYSDIETPPSESRISSLYRGNLKIQEESIPVEARAFNIKSLLNQSDRERHPTFFWKVFAEAEVLWSEDSTVISNVQNDFKASYDTTVEDEFLSWKDSIFMEEVQLFQWDHNEMLDGIVSQMEKSPLAAMARFTQWIHMYCQDVLKLICLKHFQSQHDISHSELSALADAYFRAQSLKNERYFDPMRYPVHSAITDLLLSLGEVFRIHALSVEGLTTCKSLFQKHFYTFLGQELYPLELTEVFQKR
jgi:hypothetical protein